MERLPEDFIAVQMVLDSTNHQVITYPDNGEYDHVPVPRHVHGQLLRTPYAGSGRDGLLDCHELYTPAFAPWCISDMATPDLRIAAGVLTKWRAESYWENHPSTVEKSNVKK